MQFFENYCICIRIFTKISLNVFYKIYKKLMLICKVQFNSRKFLKIYHCKCWQISNVNYLNSNFINAYYNENIFWKYLIERNNK